MQNSYSTLVEYDTYYLLPQSVGHLKGEKYGLGLGNSSANFSGVRYICARPDPATLHTSSMAFKLALAPALSIVFSVLSGLIFGLVRVPWGWASPFFPSFICARVY